MSHLDITIDLETLATCPTAAIIQIGAVAWLRNAKAYTEISSFKRNVDITSCVAKNLTISESTLRFWSEENPSISAEAREDVLGGNRTPLTESIRAFIEWIEEQKADAQADTVNIWSQGTDFDIAIIRNAARKCGLDTQLDKVFHYTAARDARTFILYLAPVVFGSHAATERYVGNPYALLPKEPADTIKATGAADTKSLVHTSLYDAHRTSYNVWSIMQALECSLHANDNANLNANANGQQSAGASAPSVNGQQTTDNSQKSPLPDSSVTAYELDKDTKNKFKGITSTPYYDA